MRAWHSSLILVALACGGSTDVIDGGDDAATGNDVTTSNDTGTGNDTGTTVDASSNDVTTTNDTGTTVDAGPFDPSQLGTDLVLWLDANKGITKDVNNNNNVLTWADQTSYHNDASGSGGNQNVHEPSVNATAINNLPAVIFSSQQNTYLQITDSVSLEFGTGDFAIFMVAEYANSTQNQGSQGTFYAKVAGNTTPRGPQLYGNAFVNNAYTSNIRARIDANDNVNSTATGFNDAKFHRIGIRRNGSALEVWTDGTLTSFTPDAGGTLDVSAGGSDVYIGIQQPGGFGGVRLQGGIAEVIGVKGTLSSTDVTSLDGYFKTKYAL